MKLPDRTSALKKSDGPALRMSCPIARRCQKRSGNIVASNSTERQNETSHADISMRRTMTPAVLNNVAALTANSTPSAAELDG